MTALADSSVNGAELPTKMQSPSTTSASALSPFTDGSEPVAVRVTRAAAVLITVIIAVASFVLLRPRYRPLMQPSAAPSGPGRWADPGFYRLLTSAPVPGLWRGRLAEWRLP